MSAHDASARCRSACNSNTFRRRSRSPCAEAEWDLSAASPARSALCGHFFTARRATERYNWHSAGCLGWPFAMLKYKYIFQIKYTAAIPFLSNSTRKLLGLCFEIATDQSHSTPHYAEIQAMSQQAAAASRNMSATFGVWHAFGAVTLIKVPMLLGPCLYIG